MTLTEDSTWTRTRQVRNCVYSGPSTRAWLTEQVRPAEATVVRLDGAPDSWRKFVDRLAQFSGYPANWNGYGERPISDVAITRAANTLVQLARALPGYPPSTVVPLATGGVQMEWLDGDLLLEVQPGGELEAYEADSDMSWDIKETADWSQFVRLLVR